MVKISEIMTKNIVTINAEDTINKAISIMENNSIKELPVIQGDVVLGVLKLYALLQHQKIQDDEKVKTHAVPVPSLRENADVWEAIGIIVNSGEEFILVFDDKDNLVGVVSDYDILKTNKEHFSNFHVAAFLKKIEPIDAEDSIAKAKISMEKHRIDRLPVHRENQYIGQVMWSDLLRATSRLTRKAYGSKVGENIESTKMPVGNLVNFRESVFENESVENAIKIMIKKQIRGLPVLNINSEVMGVLLRRDLIKQLLPEQEGIPIQFSGDDLDNIKQAEIIEKLSDRIKRYEHVESLKIHTKKLKGTRYEVYLKAKVGNEYHNVKKDGKMMPALDECIHDLKVLIKEE